MPTVIYIGRVKIRICAKALQNRKDHNYNLGFDIAGLFWIFYLFQKIEGWSKSSLIWKKYF